MAVMLFSLMTWSLVSPAAVYRWVDENGNVQFSDRPVSETAKEVEIKEQAPLYKDDSGNARQRQIDQQKMLHMFDEQRQEKAERDAKAKKEAAKRDRLCAGARDRLQRYRRSSSLYNPQSDGSRQYLSDAEREAAIAETEREVSRWCK